MSSGTSCSRRWSRCANQLNAALKKNWEEWEIPREADAKWPDCSEEAARRMVAARIARQKEIDASIAAKADFEYLYDKPYEDKQDGPRRRAVHRREPLAAPRPGVDENDDLIDRSNEVRRMARRADLRRDDSGKPEDRRRPASAQGRQDHFHVAHAVAGRTRLRRGSLSRGRSRIGKERARRSSSARSSAPSAPDLVPAAREAGDAGFDVLIACAFNYEAHTTEFNKLGRIPVLKARMNADLHMADDLKNTGKGNLFVIFGEPDIDILIREQDGRSR